MPAIEEVQSFEVGLVPQLEALFQQLSSSRRGLGADEVRALVEDPASSLLVARLDGLVVGTATLVSFRTADGLLCRIEDVVVDSRVRGRGIGESLVLACLQGAQDRGAHAVSLNSAPTREAANVLYRKLGFELRDTNSYVWHP